MATASVKIHGSHSDCGGGVIAVVAAQNEGEMLKCLNCGKSESVPKGEDATVLVDTTKAPDS